MSDWMGVAPWRMHRTGALHQGADEVAPQARTKRGQPRPALNTPLMSPTIDIQKPEQQNKNYEINHIKRTQRR